MKQVIIIASSIPAGGLGIKRPMKLSIILFASVIVGIAFSGCATKYGCPVPGGVQCRSISEVYSGTKTGRPMDPISGKMEKERVSPAKPTASLLESPGGVPPDATAPLRSAPKVLRVWVAPWIDRDGDLHQKEYLYIVVDPGRWAIGLPAMESEPVPAIKMTPEASPGDTLDPHGPESLDNGK